MISVTRLSRWTMYVGLFAFFGTLMAGQVLSAAVSALLALQYPAVELYRGYSSGRQAAETAVREP